MNVVDFPGLPPRRVRKTPPPSVLFPYLDEAFAPEPLYRLPADSDLLATEALYTADELADPKFVVEEMLWLLRLRAAPRERARAPGDLCVDLCSGIVVEHRRCRFSAFDAAMTHALSEAA